jgi:hypothetical protein
VIIESRILGDRAALQIGLAMELTFVPLFTDANGDEVICFAFQPLGKSS